MSRTLSYPITRGMFVEKYDGEDLRVVDRNGTQLSICKPEPLCGVLIGLGVPCRVARTKAKNARIIFAIAT
jgi:hypothetical protein